MSLSAGTRLGPYEVISPIGAGGMGEVYKAKDTRLGRDVAVKVLPADFAADAERRRRFEQEARAASALNHPNIVSVYDIGTEGGAAYIAMELVEGQSLRVLADSGPLSPRRVLDIAAPLAGGLARAHAAGIVHRDLKPENVIVSKDGFVKILDFGLAKATAAPKDDGSQMPTMDPATGAGTVLGTVAYMSPEQAAGRTVDHRSDQFSFATILYELLSGRKPFVRPTAVETMSAILREDPAPLSQSGIACPAPLRWIVDRCHAKEPDGRYASTLDLARELASLRDHYSELSSASGMSAAAEAPRRKRIGVREIAALAAAGLIGAAAVRLLSRPSPPAPPLRIRALTYSGHDVLPASSPDGKTVAFASDRDGRSRIWLRQLATGGEAPVTDGVDLSPRFFPDGESILYSHAENGTRSLYRLALVGGQPRRLIENADQGDVSPDGGRIAFVRSVDEHGRLASSVWIARTDGGDARRLLSDADHVFLFPRFSPDGRTIAVLHGGQAGSRGEIPLISLDGAPPRVVKAAFPNSAMSAVLWSRNGKGFYSIQADSSLGGVLSTEGHLVRYDAATGRPSVLEWTPVTATSIALAGNRLVFDGGVPRENLKAISLSDRTDGSDSRWLTRGLIVDRQPAPGPDGDQVVFSSNRNGNQDIWSVSLKTGAAVSLTDDPAEDWDPALTPDGKHLLWSSNRSGKYEIWIADADGSHPRQLTHDGDAENPTATPDGRWIVYASGVAANAGIWKIRSDGGQATRLAGGYLLNPEVSPDGEYVAYRVIVVGGSRALVKVLRVADGTILPFEIAAPDLGNGQAGRVRWMRGGKALAYLAADEHGIQGIFAQDFIPGSDTSATRRRLGGFDRDIAAESFGVTRDDATLVVAGIEQTFNLMTMEHVPGLESASGGTR